MKAPKCRGEFATATDMGLETDELRERIRELAAENQALYAANTAHVRRVEELEAEVERLREVKVRCRLTAQILIEEIGAGGLGAQNADIAARRAVEEITTLRALIAKLREKEE